MHLLNCVIKRFIDFFGALIGVVLISPLLLLIAALIKLTSKGPIFFLQERLGRHGQPFKIIKFRTMVVGAENIGDGLKVRSSNDARITKIGQYLRKYSLDELPQLFNVIAGQMSLVGPRPPVTYFPYDGYENYPEWAKKRFSMRPGMTGWSQVSVRNSVSWDERIVLDNYYIDNFNIWLDIKILIKTFYKLIKPSLLYLNESQHSIESEQSKSEILT